MNIQTITYQDALPIRHTVLWPNKPIEFCKVEGDEQALHYGMFVDSTLVCVASIYIDQNSARLRKFATLQTHQGQGIGSQVITHILEDLKHLNVNHFWCDARATAVSFYQRFGMQTSGSQFMKSDVPYFKMAINL